MLEAIFLICLGLIWILFSVFQDLKTHEVANWLNISLIIFALSFRFFWSLFELKSFEFFYFGLIGLGVFFILGNLLYYSRVFAGGDAKLMIALGTIIPIYSNFSDNLKLILIFLFAFLISGAVYGLVASFGIALNNRKNFVKEFNKRFKKNKIRNLLFMFCGIVFLILGFVGINEYLFFIGILVFVFPYLYLFAKSVDESCMIKKVSGKKLTEGDWLYKDLKIGKKLLKASWDGLSKEEIGLIKKSKKEVLIRTGIAYTPVFLISFLIFSAIVLFKEFFLEFLFLLN